MWKDEILTIGEVAKFLKVSERTVYDWALKGKIPGGKIGTVWRFKRSEVEAWVDAKIGAAEKADRNKLELAHILTPERILFLDGSTKKEALDGLIQCISQAPEVTDPHELERGIYRREKLMSTGIGCGIAVPHVRLASVEHIVVAVGVSQDGITDYESIDNEPIRLVFMIAAGRDQHVHHIRTLSEISSRIKNKKLRKQAFAAADNISLYEILTRKDEYN